MQNALKESNACSYVLRGHRKFLSGILIYILIVGFFGFSGRTAGADQLSLLVNGKAIHFNSANKNFNEKNWGAGLQYDLAPINENWIPFVTVSGFKDSNRNPSYYAGGGIMRRYQFDHLHVEAGVVGFVMTRKDFRDDKPFIGVLPAFSLGTKNVSVNMTFVPKVDPKAVPLVFFQLKIKLTDLN